jgi:hypothetical protein
VTEAPPLPYASDAPPPTKRGFGSGAGRRVGQKDRVSIALKEAILLAGETVGDELADAAESDGHPDGLMGYLTMVARTDPKTFCGLLRAVLPTQIKLDGKLDMTPIINLNAKPSAKPS